MNGSYSHLQFYPSPIPQIAISSVLYNFPGASSIYF